MASPAAANVPANIPAHIQPQGFASTIIGVTALFTLLCLVAVTLRMWVRLRDRIFQVEDGFMLAGLITNLTQYGVVCWGTTVGIGSSDPTVLMNPLLMMGLLKVEYYLNLTYLITMGLVKTSVCGTLLRINRGSSRKSVTWALWVVMLVIVVSSLGGLITFIVRCSADTGCQDSDYTMSIMNWVGVAFYMFCDLALAVIPIFIIKDLKMKRSLKVSTVFTLGLGGLACLAAVLRIPAQLGLFGSGANSTMYNLGSFVLWTEIELGLGIVCGCAPAMRKIFKGWVKDEPKSSNMQAKPYQYPPTPRNNVQRVGPMGYSPSMEKMYGHVPGTPQSIAHPTKTFATNTTSTTVSSRTLEQTRTGSSRGLIEYQTPMDVEQAGIWGPTA